MIYAKQLTKRFGNFEALKGIDLHVKPGEIYGFIGPNGAGKSTTIRILLGLIRATSGSATIFEKDVWRESVEIHKRIAYIPGDVSFWPNLTGGEVIDLFFHLRGINDRKRRDELIERFQFDPTKKCRTYSTGNRQKIALISAFASEADLYILDEPTSGLDPLMERVFQQIVLEEKEKGKSVLFSSHILSEVERLCDRVSIIREGKIIESGSLEELRHLTRMKFTVTTKHPLANLSDFDGVYDIVEEKGKTSFSIDQSAISRVMTYLSEREILVIESKRPTLEDLFIEHYQTEGDEYV